MFDYNKGKVIHSAKTDDFTVDILEKEGIRWLRCGPSGTQSAIQLDDLTELQLHYTRTMLSTMACLPQSPKTLLLGLGGGSLVHYLLHHYPQSHITAIEYSSLIIQLAHEYFFIPKNNAHLTIVHADAARYVQETQETFDFILVDVYNKLGIPEAFTRAEFFQRCNHLLSDHGICSINVIAQTQEAFMQILQTIRNEFSNRTLSIPVKKTVNTIVHAFKRTDFNKFILKETNEGQFINPRYEVGVGFVVDGDL